MSVVVLSVHEINALRKALEFYAEGSNRETIVNRWPVNFDEERVKLEEKGFRFDGEAYNGDEYYVEQGQTAQRAIQTIDHILATQQNRIMKNA